MGFYDGVWNLHSCFRYALVYPNEAGFQKKKAMMEVWRRYAELNVSDFSSKEISKFDLDDLASEVLLDVILGPEEEHPMGTAAELVKALELDPKLFEYCRRRTSPSELFSLLSDKPPLMHARIVRESLEQLNIQLNGVPG